MENIKIEATSNTPKVDFDFSTNEFFLGGESFSEEVSEIYENLISQTTSYLEDNEGLDVHFTCELIYFNSLSARKIFQLLTMFDEAGEDKHNVTIIWVYRSYDDNMLEFGEEYGEDIEHATFILKEIEDD